MSFFDKFKEKAFPSIAASFLDADTIANLAPMATNGILDMLKREELDAGANIVCILALNEDKTALVLATYKEVAGEGLQLYKNIDITNPQNLLKLLKNDTTDIPSEHAATTFTAIEHRPSDTATDTATTASSSPADY